MDVLIDKETYHVHDSKDASLKDILMGILEDGIW
jgi:hypothetical protein